MAKYLLLIGILGTASNDIWGQTLEPIQTDRPDQTECPFIVPKKFIQVESGFLIQKQNDSSQSSQYPSALWKYGISDRVEFRIITEFTTEKISNKTTSGLTPITIGFKVNLWEEKGILPRTSFIGHITTRNIGSKSFSTPYLAPSFRFTMQHTLSDKITLGYNLGAEWDGQTPATTFIYTLTTGFSISEKMGSYIEFYGFAPQDAGADNNFDGGITYLINNNLQLDFSGGFGITKSALEKYVALGISFRFNTAKK